MAWLHSLTDYIHGLAWLQLMIDSFWSLLSAGLQFTLPLAILSFYWRDYPWLYHRIGAPLCAKTSQVDF